MVSPIRGCAAALAALLIPAGASAQDLSGEIDLLELHTDFDQTNLLIDATFDLRQGTRGFEVKATGNGDVGPSMDELQLQGLFLQELGPSTALMAGVRHDFRRGHDVTYASVAVTLGASREEALSTFESAWRSLADGNPEGEVG